MDIYTIIIAAAPALTSIIALVAGFASLIGKIKALTGNVNDVGQILESVKKENVALKAELKKVYKLHSEIVEHIYYKEGSDDENEQV